MAALDYQCHQGREVTALVHYSKFITKTSIKRKLFILVYCPCTFIENICLRALLSSLRKILAYITKIVLLFEKMKGSLLLESLDSVSQKKTGKTSTSLHLKEPINCCSLDLKLKVPQLGHGARGTLSNTKKDDIQARNK